MGGLPGEEGVVRCGDWVTVGGTDLVGGEEEDQTIVPG